MDKVTICEFLASKIDYKYNIESLNSHAVLLICDDFSQMDKILKSGAPLDDNFYAVIWGKADQKNYPSYSEMLKIYFLESFLAPGLKEVFLLQFIKDKNVRFIYDFRKEGEDLENIRDFYRVERFGGVNFRKWIINGVGVGSGGVKGCNSITPLQPPVPILFLVPFLTVGGAEKVLLDIVSNLAPKYLPIIATTLQSKNLWHSKFLLQTPYIYHLGELFKEDEGENKENFIFDLIDKYKIKLVYLSNSQWGYEFLPKLKQRVPDIHVVDLLHTHDPDWDYLKFSVPYKDYIDKRMVVAPFLKDLLISKFGETSDRISVMGVGIDLEKFKRRSFEEKVLLKEKFSLPSNSKICSFIGRFSEEKRPLFFIEIARRVLGVEKQREIHFLMAGGGDLFKEAGRMVRRLGLGERVKLLGFRDDIANILAVSDILVMPSLYEGCPITALEAMSSEVPVIASNTRGLDAVIKNGEEGFLCEKTSVSDFASKIIALLKNRNLARNCGIRGRNRAENYSLRAMMERYCNLYKNML